MSAPLPESIEDFPADFTTDEGDEYVRLDPARFDDFDEVDATTIDDPGAAQFDGLATGGEH